MEAQVCNIFLSMWNQQKYKPLGSGPLTIPEQGFNISRMHDKLCCCFWQPGTFNDCFKLITEVRLHNARQNKTWQFAFTESTSKLSYVNIEVQFNKKL